MILLALAALLAAPDIVLQNGHGANISALAFSPDGKYLVSASEDATLKLWDPQSGAEIRTLRGHTNIVTSLAINSDGTQVASASLDHTLRVWNPATGEALASLKGPAPTVYLLRISPDSRSLITAETVPAGTILRIWEVSTGRQIGMIKRDDAAVSNVFFSGETMFVAEESGEDDTTGSLTTYNFQNGREIQSRPVLLCGASNDGRWIAVDRSDESQRRALIVDVKRDKTLATISGQVSRVVFSNSGEWLAYEASSGDTAIVRRTADGTTRAIRGRGAEFSMIALSPDGRWLATAGADFSLHIWDADTGKLAHGASGQYTPSVIAFSPDGRKVAANGGGTDLGSALQLWDIARRATLPVPRIKRTIGGLSFSKDGAYLAVATSLLEIFDTRTNALVAKFDCGSSSPMSPAFSPNGKWVAANCAGVTKVWALASGAEAFHFAAPDNGNGLLLFAPDGRLLARGSASGIALFDTVGKKVVNTIKTPDPVSSMAFSASGGLLAFGLRFSVPRSESPPTISLVDLRAKRRLWSTAVGQWVSSLQFTKDSHALLVASGDDPHKAGSIKLIDSATGRLIRNLGARVPSTTESSFSSMAEWFGAGINSATSLWRLPER